MRTPLAWTLRVAISPWNSLPDLLEGTDVQPLSLSWIFCFRARDHRGLDGDRKAEGDRRRTRLRAAATRRTQAGEFLVSRGMGAAQGKKLARRRCGIGDRGAAGLRPDQAIEEAVWERRHQTATKQENWRPSFTGRNLAALGETAPSSQPFRPVSQTEHSRTPRDTDARLWQSIGLAPPAPPVPARASTAPLSQRRPDDPSTPDHGPSSEPRNGDHDVRYMVDGSRRGEWVLPVRCPTPADREPAGRQSRWRRRR